MNAILSVICIATVVYAKPQLSNYNNNGRSIGQGAFNGEPRASATNLPISVNSISGLEEALPGIPGEDYPILAEVPETSFTCDGQIEGGFYADPQTDCQAFHVCASDADIGLRKISFLCPNGTIFNQEYFVCDWWFNFDCADAETLYSRNEEIAAEREAIDAAGGNLSLRNGNGPISSASSSNSVPESVPASIAQPKYQSRSGRFLQNRRGG